MARSIEHRAQYPATPPTVYGTLVDAEFLHARLAELGGRDAALLEHRVGERDALVTLRQGVPVEFLPSVVRRFTGEDLILDRTERWRPGPDEGWVSDVDVTVRGLPGSITGTQEIRGDAGSATVVLSGQARVPVPMVGGKIEGVVAEQVTALLGFESDFTRRWLAEHG